jgi:hypothetical protein
MSPLSSLLGFLPKRPSSDPRWRHRRRLVYGAFGLSVFMILFAAFDSSDRQVSAELVTGGVALMSIILSAYVGFATLDHRWQAPDYEEDDPDADLHP